MEEITITISEAENVLLDGMNEGNPSEKLAYEIVLTFLAAIISDRCYGESSTPEQYYALQTFSDQLQSSQDSKESKGIESVRSMIGTLNLANSFNNLMEINNIVAIEGLHPRVVEFLQERGVNV